MSHIPKPKQNQIVRENYFTKFWTNLIISSDKFSNRINPFDFEVRPKGYITFFILRDTYHYWM